MGYSILALLLAVFGLLSSMELCLLGIAAVILGVVGLKRPSPTLSAVAIIGAIIGFIDIILILSVL